MLGGSCLHGARTYGQLGPSPLPGQQGLEQPSVGGAYSLLFLCGGGREAELNESDGASGLRDPARGLVFVFL